MLFAPLELAGGVTVVPQPGNEIELVAAGLSDSHEAEGAAAVGEASQCRKTDARERQSDRPTGTLDHGATHYFSGEAGRRAVTDSLDPSRESSKTSKLRG